jgi:hypothetical protein
MMVASAAALFVMGMRAMVFAAPYFRRSVKPSHCDIFFNLKSSSLLFGFKLRQTSAADSGGREL